MLVAMLGRENCIQESILDFIMLIDIIICIFSLVQKIKFSPIIYLDRVSTPFDTQQ